LRSGDEEHGKSTIERAAHDADSSSRADCGKARRRPDFADVNLSAFDRAAHFRPAEHSADSKINPLSSEEAGLGAEAAQSRRMVGHRAIDKRT
jgi:hypothetical protein